MELRDWNLSELGENIWKNKYQYNGESFEEWLNRVSNGDEDIKQLIRDKKFLFGGRILSNRGLDKLGNKVTYSNCYVLPQVEDSIEDIYKTCSDLARTFSVGGGCGIDISKLRPNGAKVNNSAKTTTGACSFMDTFSQVTETIGQHGRRGALMISIDVDHPDIEEFIDIKQDLNKVTKANISVKVNDEFMDAVKNNELWCLNFTTETGETIDKLVDAKELFMKLCERNWNYAEPGILYWNTIEDYNILSADDEFEYAGVNPCAEEPLPAGGSCLLGSFNLSAYVKNNKFDYDEFKKDIHIVVKGMNDVLDEGLPLHPLQIQKDTVRDYRQIGIGVMGIADMLIKLGLKYGDGKSIELCDKIGFTLANESMHASSLLAKEYGVYPKYKECIKDSEYLMTNVTYEVDKHIREYGLRNSQILTIAPTGSLSTMLGISGGIEPIFENSYTRKTESLHGEDVYYKVYTPIVKDYMDKHGITNEKELPDYFVTAMSLDPLKRVKMQGVWQKHIDASISSTVNLPNEATVEDVYNIYMNAWEEGLKGITIYRDGCARTGVLTTKEDKEESNELKRGEWSEKPNDTIYIEKKIKTGCGKLKLFVGLSLSENKLVDMYIKRVADGGCVHNIDALVISMSGMLRLGGSLENITKAFKGCGVCNSFTRGRSKGKELSKGSSCPTAILNAIKEVEEEYLNQNKKIEKNETIKDIKAVSLEDNENICPECGEKLSKTGGCEICQNCGYSKCN